MRFGDIGLPELVVLAMIVAPCLVSVLAVLGIVALVKHLRRQ